MTARCLDADCQKPLNEWHVFGHCDATCCVSAIKRTRANVPITKEPEPVVLYEAVVISICENPACQKAIHGKREIRFCSAECRAIEVKKELEKKAKKCKRIDCESLIPWDRLRNQFCSDACRDLNRKEWARKWGTNQSEATKAMMANKICLRKGCKKTLAGKNKKAVFCGEVCKREHYKSILRSKDTSKPFEDWTDEDDDEDLVPPEPSDYPCVSCAHGKEQPVSDTGWECSKGLYMACKPYTHKKHWVAR